MALVASSIEDSVLNFAKRWNFDEYARITELFHEPPLRVELIDGVIVEQLSLHLDRILSIRLTADAVRSIFGPAFDVNTNLPTRMGDDSAPKPDVTVLQGQPRHFENRWPEAYEIPLVVEVADSRPDTARGAKIRIYARFGIAEYWILDLRKRILEVRRGPLPDEQQWTETRIYQESESITPLGTSGTAILISDLLPRLQGNPSVPELADSKTM